MIFIQVQVNKHQRKHKGQSKRQCRDSKKTQKRLSKTDHIKNLGWTQVSSCWFLYDIRRVNRSAICKLQNNVKVI